MRFIIFFLNIFIVAFSVFVASPFVVSGLVLSIGGPRYPYEAFYIDFGLLFLHLFYIIFLVIGVLYSLNSYKKSIKKGLIFVMIPYIYTILLMLFYSQK